MCVCVSNHPTTPPPVVCIRHQSIFVIPFNGVSNETEGRPFFSKPFLFLWVSLWIFNHKSMIPRKESSPSCGNQRVLSMLTCCVYSQNSLDGKVFHSIWTNPSKKKPQKMYFWQMFLPLPCRASLVRPFTNTQQNAWHFLQFLIWFLAPSLNNQRRKEKQIWTNSFMCSEAANRSFRAPPPQCLRNTSSVRRYYINYPLCSSANEKYVQHVGCSHLSDVAAPASSFI